MPFGISFLWIVLVTTQVPVQRYKWLLKVSLLVGPVGHWCEILQLIIISLTEEKHKDVFNACLAGPNLDIFCVWLSNVGSFCENYAKIYFDAKHL